MKVVHYTEGAHVRHFSELDLLRTFGITLKEGLTIDARVDRNAIVSNRLAAKLAETGEFVIVGSETDNEDDAVYEQERIEAQRLLANGVVEYDVDVTTGVPVIVSPSTEETEVMLAQQVPIPPTDSVGPEDSGSAASKKKK